MTKKDYKLIADLLRDLLRDQVVDGTLTRPTFITIAFRFARAFERDNPRFDRTEFLQAAGVDL